MHYALCSAWWQKLCETRRPSPKSLDLDKNSKLNIRYFVAILWFVQIYALFGRLWAKKVIFWVSVSWTRSALLHSIYCILYWIIYWQKFLWPVLRSLKGCQLLQPCHNILIKSPFLGWSHDKQVVCGKWCKYGHHCSDRQQHEIVLKVKELSYESS